QRAAEGRLQRRRGPAVRVGVLRQPGAVAEARASGADGPRLSRAEAHGAPHGAGVRATRKDCGHGRARSATEAGVRREEGEGVTVGKKVPPFGFRLGFKKRWKSLWYAEKDYAKLLHEDIALKRSLKKRFAPAGVSKLETSRAANRLKIDI